MFGETNPVAAGSGPIPAHYVQFYESPDLLVSTVTTFLQAGIAAGEPAVIIATPEHRAAFCASLASAGADIEFLLSTGRLQCLDARETLNAFMTTGLPDPDRFEAVVGSSIRVAVEMSSSRQIRAYGEMVDLLWGDGHRTAAIALEELWNGLIERQPVALLCAYSMDGFLKGVDDAALVDVCRCHHHAAPVDFVGSFVESDSRTAAVVRNRQTELEAEVAHRRDLEAALRSALREQRQAEALARQHQQDLTDFIENAAEGLHWVGPDGRIIWANQAELDLVGRTAEEYVGHHLSEFHADTVALGDLLARLNQNETLRNFPAQLRHKDGSRRHVLINSNVMRRDGQFIHTRCFTRDVTDLRHVQAELEHAVEARDDLLSTAAHELRNPLHVIQLQMTVLHDALQQDTSSRDWLLGRVIRVTSQLSRVGRLLDNLLDVSRISSGRLQLELEDCDASDVVADVIERYRAQLATLSTSLESCPGRWDRVRLDQVATNLISNAIKFGEGRAIEVSLASTSEAVTVRVTDHGIGIRAEDLPHLFDRFEQRAAEQYGGFGLGLWITKRIVTAMGGSIAVESEIGRGSAFSVTVPRISWVSETPA